MARGRGKGERCTYCRRTMEASTARSLLAATRDHLVPQCMDGTVTVWCCYQCNSLKANLTPAQWTAFMLNNPEWWKKPAFRKRVARVQGWEIAGLQPKAATVEDAIDESCKAESAAIPRANPESVIR